MTRYNYFCCLVICHALCCTVQVFGQSQLPAPTRLAAKATAYNQVVLSWEDKSGNDETGFEIYRDAGLGTNFQLITTTGKDATTYTDNSVSGNSLYYYRVRATSLRQKSAFSNDGEVSTPVPPPAAPSGLAVSLINNTTIRLTWNGNNSADASFYVERANRTTGQGFTQIAEVAYSRALSYDDPNLSGGNEYCYRIRAHNVSGESGYTNVACSTTPSSAPDAPARLAVSASSESKIALTWVDASNNETGFELERAEGARGTFSKIADLGANTASYDDNNLKASTEYCYRLRAKNAAGNSGYAGPACATTLAPTVTIPRPPSALTASNITSQSAQLKWADNSDNEAGFDLQRSTDGTDFKTITQAGANQTNYGDNALTPNTRYWYRIASSNRAGSSPYSNIVEIRTPDEKPVAPVRLEARAVTSTQIDLQWADVSQNETGFELQISTDGSAFQKLADLPANTTTHQAMGLKVLTKYWFRIQAKNAIGVSDYSNVASATTFDVPPVAPTNLSANAVSASLVKLAWKDESSNETGFEIHRSTDGTKFDKVADVGTNVLQYDDASARPATKYWYKVRAVNTVNPSAFSNIVSVTTPDVAPSAPARLEANATSYDKISLSWADLSGNETGFQIERSVNGGGFSKVAEVTANTTKYEDTGLASETRHAYRVRAVNAIGPSGYSNVAEATTQKAPIPNVPRDLTAIPLDFDLIQLRWSPLSSNATEVVIERSPFPDKGFVQIGKQAASIIQFPDREILDVADYYYRIKAVNQAGSSAYSALAKVAASSIITGTEPLTGQDIYAHKGVLYFDIKQFGDQAVNIYDQVGRLRKSFKSKSPSQTPIHDLPQGIYIVTVTNQDRSIRKKIWNDEKN